MRTCHAIAGPFLMTLSMLVSRASAQCPPDAEQLVPFNLGVRLGSTLDGYIQAAVAWDPDGAGPEREWVVIGSGLMTSVQGMGVSHFAAWDGATWRSVAPDLRESGFMVRAMAVHQGHLVVAADAPFISNIVVRNLFELTLDGWQRLGGVPGPSCSGEAGSIQCLLSVGDSMFVAGSGLCFEGGQSSPPIVRWDGAAYRDIGYPFPSDSISAMTMHQGNLYVTGSLGRDGTTPMQFVARYDGKVWSQVGEGIDRVGVSMFSDGEFLYVGTIPEVFQESVAYVWDGVSWSPTGGGDLVGKVNAWSALDGHVVGAGRMGSSSPLKDEMSAWRLVDDAWVPIAPNIPPLDQWGRETRSLLHWDGDLIAAGNRHMPSQFRYSGGIARLQDGMWTTLDHSLDGSMLSLFSLGDSLIAAGQFTSAGGIFTPGMCVLSKGGVEPFRAPILFRSHEHSAVRTVVPWGDRVFVLGDFLTDDSASMGIVVRDASGAWSPVPHPFSWFDADKAVVVDGSLYVLANTTSAFHSRGIVALDEDGTWRAIEPASRNLRAVVNYGGNVHVAGNFSTLGGVAVSGVARFDGSTWHALGQGLSGDVYDLFEHEGALWAAGSFTIRESGVAAKLAEFDGESWHAASTPVAAWSKIVRARSIGGRLYVSGDGEHAFVWSGGSWAPLIFNGLNRGFADVVEHDGRIFALGTEQVSGDFWNVPFELHFRCPADYDCDGVTDILDFLEFFRFYGPCADQSGGCNATRADFNQDGVIDVLDVMDFIDAFAGGC